MSTKDISSYESLELHLNGECPPSLLGMILVYDSVENVFTCTETQIATSQETQHLFWVEI